MSLDGEEDTRSALVILAADEKAVGRIMHLLALLLEGDEGLVTLSAQSADRPDLERALAAARRRSPRGPQSLREQ